VVPIITILQPTPNQLCGVTAPNFAISINEPYLDKAYSFDPMAYGWRPFTTETRFRQDDWDKVGNGTVLIQFRAHDRAASIGYSNVTVLKDVYVPDIIVHAPLNNEKFGKVAPNYSISIIEEEGDLVSTWYTLEYYPYTFVDTFPLTELNGTINQVWWDDAPKGDIRITFYAEDRAGNIESEVIYVIKSIPSKPVIPGYNLFFLLGILAVVLIFISKKVKKS